jgi:hypothetical protein
MAEKNLTEHEIQDLQSIDLIQESENKLDAKRLKLFELEGDCCVPKCDESFDSESEEDFIDAIEDLLSLEEKHDHFVDDNLIKNEQLLNVEKQENEPAMSGLEKLIQKQRL